MSDQDTVFGNASTDANEKPAEQATETAVSELVGEGRKYATAEAALASIPHAQAHIKTLEGTLDELREELAKRTTAEEILNKIQEAKANSEDHTPHGLSAEEAATLVKETIASTREEERAQANILTVDQQMKTIYKEKAPEVLSNKARELGMSLSEMQSLAARSPTAFFSMIGVRDTKDTQETLQSSVNTEVLNTHPSGAKPDTFAYYERIRKENPNEYFSRKTQRAIHDAAMRLGEAFYN